MTDDPQVLEDRRRLARDIAATKARMKGERWMDETTLAQGIADYLTDRDDIDAASVIGDQPWAVAVQTRGGDLYVVAVSAEG